jgi:hypothetical protein
MRGLGVLHIPEDGSVLFVDWRRVLDVDTAAAEHIPGGRTAAGALQNLSPSTWPEQEL